MELKLTRIMLIDMVRGLDPPTESHFTYSTGDGEWAWDLLALQTLDKEELLELYNQHSDKKAYTE